jgi:hypothetical protein
MSSFRRTSSLKNGDMPSADEHVEESYGHFILTYYYTFTKLAHKRKLHRLDLQTTSCHRKRPPDDG